jgi:hypothetical protein
MVFMKPPKVDWDAIWDIPMPAASKLMSFHRVPSSDAFPVPR